MTDDPGRSDELPLWIRLADHGPLTPALELRMVLADSARELMRAQDRLTDHYTRLQRIAHQDAARSRDRPDGIEVVAEPDRFRDLAHRLLHTATEEGLLLLDESAADLSPPPTTPHPLRMICVRPLLADPDRRERIEAALTAGHGVRVLPALPASLLAVDGTALLALPPTDQPRQLLLVRSPALVALLTQYVEALWRQAIPLADGVATDTDGAPTPVQRQILRLAAAGLKDESIARSLGRSVRWVRRHFEVLEERLSATNRLTLGIAAVRRGWI
ncbi:hypothetical protein [Micromonospora sp. NPDC005806]|uniref:hypothetical protein n=1 Tax=Micromonospora sp. NPDC005806 TaxID=3364234 RepID=UPI0036AB3B5A